MRKSFPTPFHIFLSFLLILPFTASADFTLNLDSGWTFRRANEPAQAHYAATVPGTVHTDLFANGIIPDPFLGTNETKVRWIDSTTWEYFYTFNLTRAMRKEKHVELQFDGLDTYADVYVNDVLMFTAENMFLSYTKDIKAFLKPRNTIRIVFHPAAELIKKNRMLSPIKDYPGGDRVFIRKAQYHFGWDWGPTFVTCGIWKPVRIVGWSDFRISDVRYHFDHVENGMAYVNAEFMLESDKPGTYAFTIANGDTVLYDKRGKSDKGRNTVNLTFTIPDAKLWWCNGLGEQHLYALRLSVQKKKKVQSITTVTGLRKIELSAEVPGGIGTFYFILNGVPVFAKGANWIPSDNFLSRVNNAKVAQQLTDMHDLDMNMVRVWGGGIYESDAFYSKCDSLGLMVWQDLPFACSMYPLTTLNNNDLVMAEVVDNERRLFNHPCLSMWCGDNENLEGWFNWGWQKQMKYSDADSLAIIREYYEFNRKFSAYLKSTYREMPFTPSSPLNGWGTKAAYEKGDVHYWGVWWGLKPFTEYESHTGRFVSEFGFQGLPSSHTYTQMNYQPRAWGEWRLDSVVAMHQKHSTGFETIDHYMRTEVGIVPTDMNDYILLSQMLQRDAMTMAITAQRRNAPRCMGSLFWQYNDCWPVASWSVQDYFGRKKLAWYGLKEVYSDKVVSIQTVGDSVYAWFINSTQFPIDARAEIGWFHFEGAPAYSEKMHQQTFEVGATCFWRGAKSSLFEKLPAGSGFFRAVVYSNETEERFSVSASDVLHLPASCSMPDSKYKLNFVRYITEGPCMFTIRADVYMKNVSFTCDDPDAEFSDNGFDMIPGESRQITVKTKNAGLVEESIQVTSLNSLLLKYAAK